MRTGRLYWITGLSGVGKTTLAKGLQSHLATSGQTVLLLDGDALRDIYAIPDQYHEQGRREMGMRHARLCHLLTSQGCDVICATISLFHDIRHWNRQNQTDYIEILLLCDEPERSKRLAQRDQQPMDDAAPTVGHDIQPEWPEHPDIVLQNQSSDGIDDVLRQLLVALSRRSR